MTILAIGPHVVLDHPGFIHETARLHGKVYIGPEASIWTYAVTRSELYEIRIGARSNIQDFVMIHEGNGTGTFVGRIARSRTMSPSRLHHRGRLSDRDQRDHHGRR